jgi:Zn-dependent membrane protease YugP
MFFDPVYMLVMGVGLMLSLGAQVWVKSAVGTWSRVQLGRPMTGAQVALGMLRANGIQAVRVEEVSGFLTDHYDPTTRTLRLSSANFRGTSVAAAGIAAHEAGHALQHRDGYAPMKLRQKMVPVANIGTNLGVLMVMGGIALGAAGLAQLGVILFAGFVVFTLVTLPVEFDASRRAYQALTAAGIVMPNEAAGVRTVLTAAAATYVAAALTAILQLLYFALRAGLLGGRRQE